jgi:hypothetical protein
MKTVYVTHTVLTTARFCLVVADEDDLKAQLAQREAAVRAQPFVAKPDRDKAGKPQFFELSKDWDGFTPKPWDPKE